MDKEAWWATVQGVKKVRLNLVTKLPPPPPPQYRSQRKFSALLTWELEKVEKTTLIDKICISNGYVLAHDSLSNVLSMCMDEMLWILLWGGKTSRPFLLEHIANITFLSSPRKQLNLLLANYHQEKQLCINEANIGMMSFGKLSSVSRWIMLNNSTQQVNLFSYLGKHCGA